uniref:Uncharacterized protein n=1 Tax=Nelumbo nucifera TaxID=4432 RepID=A0A822XJE7_NELNU|nr:TPA_asm: hypothetical protein HUJ06_020569 [Nelumbo nucifera]
MTTQKHEGIKLGTTETVYTGKSSMESAYDSVCGNRSNEGREKSELADDIPKPTHEDISDLMKPCHGLPGDERSLAENPVPTDFNREFKEIVDSRLANKSPLLADGEAQADSDSKSPRETCEGPESIVAIFAENKDALPSMLDEEIDPKDESARLPLLEDKENDPKGDFMESSVEVQHIDSDVETVAKSIESEANPMSARASGEMNGQPSKGYIDLASSKDGECLQQDKHCALNSAEFFCRPLEMKENQEEKLVEAEALMQPVMDGQDYLEKIAEGRDVSNESAADFVSPHSVDYTAIFKDDKVEAEINGESLEMKENQEKIVEAELLMQPVMEGQDYLEEIAEGLDMSNIPESATDFVSPHSADYTAIPNEDNKVGADGEVTVTKMPKSDELEKIDKKPLPWNEDSICNTEKLLFWPSKKKEFQREDVVESPNLEVSLHPHIVQEKSQEIIEGQSVSSSDTLDTITSFDCTGYMVAASDIETTIKQSKEETMDDQERALSELPKVEMEEQYTPSMSLEDSNDVQKEMEASEELEANGSCCCDLEKSEVADEYIMNREDCGKEKIHLVPTSEDKTHLLHGTELAESNKKLREMLNKLIQAGQEQMTIISSLNGRVRDLERKLTRKKRLRRRRGVAAASSSVDNLNCVVKDKAVDCSL